MKVLKRITAFLFSALFILTSVFPTKVLANEMIPEEPLPVVTTSNISVAVQGEGLVTLTENGNVYDVSSQSSYSQDFTTGTSLHFKVTASMEHEISDIKQDGITSVHYLPSQHNIEFDYVVSEGNSKFDIVFSPVQVVEESKEPIVDAPSTNVTNKSETSKQEIVENPSIETNENITNKKEYLLNDPDYSFELKDDGILIDFSKNHLPNTYECQMLNDYRNGMDRPEYVSIRKQKAEETGLIKYCDTNYFLKPIFYSKYGSNMLLFDGCYVLDMYGYHHNSDTITEAEQSASFFSAKALTVQQKDSHRFMNGGYWIDNVYFRLSNGQNAFCGQGLLGTPVVGDMVEPPVVQNNANLRKALYYGYGGPGDVLTARYGRDGAIVITNELASNAYCGTSIGLYSGNGFHWYRASIKIIDLWNEIMNKPDPTGYTAYSCNIPGNTTSEVTGTWGPKQDIVFGRHNPKGILNIRKVSAKPEITDNNPCYDLKGAEYGVYKSENDARNDVKRVNTLVIGSSQWKDWAQNIELDAGTYYIKETKAPKGYALNSKIVRANVKAGEKTYIGYNGEFSDEPLTDPIGLLLKKVDKDTGKPVPSGNGSLADAHFEIKYYKGLYDTDPATQGKKPERTWVLKTNANGFMRFDESHKVYGDNFYLNLDNKPSLPLGTVTFKEIKAPNGYYVNDEIFVRQIKPNHNTGGINTFNIPIVKEQAIKLHLKKVQEGTNTLIPNAQFLHIKPDGSRETVTTNSNGQLTITGLTNGRHSLQETKAPDGYDKNPTKIEFEVKSGGEIRFITNLNGTGISQVKDNNKDTVITVQDKVSPFKIQITKVNDRHILLDGAEFTIYSDKGCTQVVDVQVSRGGKLTFNNLKDRTHYYIVETRAPVGYRIPLDPQTNKPHVYEVYVESTPALNQFYFTVDGVRYSISNNNVNQPVHLEGTVADRVVAIQVVNYIGHKLPETGGMGATLMVLGGALIMLLAIKKNKKEE